MKAWLISWVNFVKQYKSANRQTKFFIWNYIFYLALTIGTGIYCYTRIQAIHQERAQANESLQSNTQKS